ncbi:hypothetical protein KR50_13830 [Jeotgalibacillus campisalis]|uniref:Uncharacterized protein n=1 Tax=Jeotgalibacillus campisalis TaxID=220754 RepID=A0A0C2VHJ7_9BACL|nr:hypothetical protein KR50_13830 [Jeotgalibacillus campisalis]
MEKYLSHPKHVEAAEFFPVYWIRRHLFVMRLLEIFLVNRKEWAR